MVNPSIEPATQIINNLQITCNSLGTYSELWGLLSLQSKLDPSPLGDTHTDAISCVLDRLEKTIPRECLLFQRLETMLLPHRERLMQGR